MRRSWRRALAAAVLLTATAVAGPAAGEPSAEDTTEVAALTLSGPVEPVAGVSGHRPTAVPDDAPAAAGPADPDSVPLGTESIIGPDDRERVTPTTTYPNGAVGQLEVVWRIRNGGTLQGSCSGALIDDDSVLAAGHCAYLHDLRYVDGPTLIESATFAPGRNRNAEPFGSCEVESAWAPPQYLDTQAATFDFSVINLAPDCDAVGTETGTFGLFARTGSMALVKANVQGYPSDMEPLGTTRWYGTQKRDHGKIVRSQKRLVFYPMDTTGGQSGGPVWRQRTAGACVGPCAMAVHAYSTDPVSTGVWGDNNAGVRLSAFRIGQILDIAAQNDGGG